MFFCFRRLYEVLKKFKTFSKPHAVIRFVNFSPGLQWPL